MRDRSGHVRAPSPLQLLDHLAANGWLYDDGDAAKYDRARALFPEDVLTWVRATQPKAADAINKNHGSHARPAHIK